MEDEEKKRPLYEPPFARDLSEECATGAELIDACSMGAHPTTNDCQFGASYQTGCSAGSMPNNPTCRSGSSASLGCVTGGSA
jgi:hypothetical protein